MSDDGDHEMTGKYGTSRPRLEGSRVAVIGIGASGEAAARLAAARGAAVYASDVAAGEAQRSAAERLRSGGIDAEVGQHDIDRILGCELAVVSPGVPPSAQVRREMREADLRTVTEAELAYWYLDSRLVGITGTNGKTTTTALCGHLLEEAGVDALTGGNIGRPLSEIALLDDQPDWVVVELSSFQLADIESLRTDVGVFLNLAPDHLDRYRDVDQYYSDKQRIFENATGDSRWVLNADDRDVLDLARNVTGVVHHVSVEGAVDRGAYLGEDGALHLRLPEREERWVSDVHQLQLIGLHNVQNALSAGLAAALVGCERDDLVDGLTSFEPLPHRLQLVGEYGGVRWVNDSKATNASATRVALRSFDEPVVLLLGGRHKGQDYGVLKRDFGGVRGVIAFGEAAPQIVGELEDGPATVRVASGLENVVDRAAEMAEQGDVVLFSPACSSYDMFPSYEVRGERFMELVRSRVSDGGGRGG